MLDIYRDAETLKTHATKKQARLYDTQVHSFLKTMATGPKHPDAVLLSKVHEGELKHDSKAMHDYLIRRLNEVPRGL